MGFTNFGQHFIVYHGINSGFGLSQNTKVQLLQKIFLFKTHMDVYTKNWRTHLKSRIFSIKNDLFIFIAGIL